VHILHVIPPARRLVITPDIGVDGVIEDDEETRRQVVSGWGHECLGERERESTRAARA
jgi:hypothetical protein